MKHRCVDGFSADNYDESSEGGKAMHYSEGGGKKVPAQFKF